MKDAFFEGREKIPRKRILDSRIKGVEDIRADLEEYSGWDGSKVATVALRLDRDGSIEQDIVHLEGFTDPKRMDATVVFGKEYGGQDHQVRIGKIDLSAFRFRGSLCSAHLEPTEFEWKVQRPATSEVGVWRDLDQHAVMLEGGHPLYAKAVCQPWTNQRLKIDIGIFACRDIGKIAEAGHNRFPMLGFVTYYVHYAPTCMEDNYGLPSMPYIIDGREAAEEEELSLPSSAEIKTAYCNLFVNPSAPHVRSNMDNVYEVLGGDWRKAKPARYCFPKPREESDTTAPEQGELCLLLADCLAIQLC